MDADMFNGYKGEEDMDLCKIELALKSLFKDVDGHEIELMSPNYPLPTMPNYDPPFPDFGAAGWRW